MRITRRTLLASSGLAVIARIVPVRAAAAAPTAPDLFIGTGGHGHTYPGPTLPFGMVQLGPDTDVDRWDACSGYHRDDTSIMGFSHTHLSGTGIGDMLDVLVVPATGPVKLTPGTLADPDAGYRQRFSDEVAVPGYYRVRLANKVLVELTVTERTGIHRYSFPPGTGHILVDLSHLILDKSDHDPLIDNAHLAWDNATAMLTGGRRVFRWAKGRLIYFALQLSRKPDRIMLYGDGDAPVAGPDVAGKRLKAVLHYDDAGVAPILIRTGISGVGEASAAANLAAEAPHWNFERYRATAAERWTDALDAIHVEGGSADQRTIMATALYHAQLAPTLFSDVDGRYRGLDRQVHPLPAGASAYSTYSLWDTYRALHPLLTLIAPDRVKSLIDDMIRQTRQSPYGPLIWPLQGVETATMMGWHCDAVLAEAWVKGIPADYAAAWPAIRLRAFDASAPDRDNSRGRGDYAALGYVPADKTWETVSRTQEYAYDDWAMAHIAEAAGATGDAAALRKRSLNYRNALDASIGFARARTSDGAWVGPYDPVQLARPGEELHDYTEANGWQATFLNQHDIYGQIAQFGGDAVFEAKLDAFFTAPSTLPADAPPDISGLIGQYAHGNEPDQHAAYLYAYVGAPWKTQALARRLCTQMYKANPDGIIGNDDCGQMSAWFVLSALGFYPVDPVSAVYVFGSPLFDRATVRLGGDRTLVVEANGNAPDRPYIRAVRWNGQPWTKSWIGHATLITGGTLTFDMVAAPNPAFGRAPADRPPSFGHGAPA